MTGGGTTAGHLLAAGAALPLRWSGASGWDARAFGAINHFARETRWLHGPLHHYARFGGLLLAVLVAAGWWTARRRAPARMAAALWAGAGTVLAMTLELGLHDVIYEPRPWRSVPGALILALPNRLSSLQAGYAVLSGAVTAGLALYHRWLAAAAAAAGGLICFAYVYIGDHFPQDVIICAGFGAVVMLASYAVVATPLTALVTWLSHTRCRRLLTARPAPPDGIQPLSPAVVSDRDRSR